MALLPRLHRQLRCCYIFLKSKRKVQGSCKGLTSSTIISRDPFPFLLFFFHPLSSFITLTRRERGVPQWIMFAYGCAACIYAALVVVLRKRISKKCKRIRRDCSPDGNGPPNGKEYVTSLFEDCYRWRYCYVTTLLIIFLFSTCLYDELVLFFFFFFLSLRTILGNIGHDIEPNVFHNKYKIK